MFEGKAAAIADMNARDYPNVPRCYECETPLAVLCLACNPREIPLRVYFLACAFCFAMGALAGFVISLYRFT